MKISNWTIKSSMILLMVISIGLVSCKDDPEEVVVPETAFVSLYHASPNTGGLDIVVDGRQINNYPLTYSDGTGYLRFYTGERNFNVTPFEANNSIKDTTTTFDNGSVYSLFIAGSYPDIQTLILEDNSEVPATGKAKLRVVHVSPDADAVSLKQSNGENSIVENLESYAASEFIDVETGAQDFVIESSGEPVLNLKDIYLSPGNYYTLVVKGYVSPPSGNENYLSAEILLN